MRWLFSVVAAVMVCVTGLSQAQGRGLMLQVDGTIGPAIADYIDRGISQAPESSAGLVILQLNTPGGLDTAMRDIVRSILASPVPVVTYVYPPGSRAASAGTYILYASHVAAMAPGTNLGAATPVPIGGAGSMPGPELPTDPGDRDKSADDKPADTMGKKAISDASAYLRSLAQMRGRNQEWAEKAVRESASLSAADALELGVIDLVARDLPQLLEQLNGRRIVLQDADAVLETSGLQVTVIEPDWRTRLLSVIADPNIAYLLILIGVYGLIFEFYNPGMIFPGVVGAISLLLALFALQVLPVNYAGLALLVLGLGFMVAEAFVPSFGILGVGGLVAFVVGSILLIDTDMPGYGVSIPLIASLSVISGLFILGVIGMAVRAREQPVVSGREELVGAPGLALDDFETEGRVQVHGESWQARSAGPVRRGQRLRVTRVDGLTLYVEPGKEE